MLTSLLARYSALGNREVDRYAGWLSALESLRDDWQRGEPWRVAGLRARLDGVPGPQRAGAIQDLIAEDLRLSWQAGKGVRLETYMAEVGGEFRDLASPAVVPAELVEDEFLARYHRPHGDMPSLEEYQQRFLIRDDVTQLLARRCVGGRFVKLHKLGLGAFGAVWEAHDRETNLRVAIKEPRSALSDRAQALRRFAEEARITACLEHHGITTLREHPPGDGADAVYVMRLVKGSSLAGRIRNFHFPGGDRSAGEQRGLWDQLLGLFAAVCDAMEYAHARGVLHRDLKPANVIIEDGGGPVILDWGAAARPPRSAEVDPTPGVIAGTPDYMAPEQADGRADERSDIFALGAILYEILTGSSPHGWSDGARPASWLHFVREARFRLPSLLRPQTPPALEAVCLKALARDPNDRFESAGELAAEVRRHHFGQPAEAGSEPISVRITRWIGSVVRGD